MEPVELDLILAVTVWPLLQEAALQGDRWKWGVEELVRGSGGFDRVWFSR